MKFEKLAKYFERLEATTKRLEMTDILSELFKSIDDYKKEVDKIIYLCQGQLLPVFKNVEFGMSEKLMHRAIVEATGMPTDKITAHFRKKGDYGETAYDLCCLHPATKTVKDVYEQLNTIAQATGSGAVAKKVGILAGLIRQTSPLEAKYIVRIILGKLRLGIGDATVLDSLSLACAKNKSLRGKLEVAYNRCSDLGLVAKILFTQDFRYIENFKVIVGCPVRVALAARLSSPKEIIEKIGECAVETKYDGFRCQIHKDGDKVTIFSRNLENTTHMFPEIQEGTVKQISSKRAMFEGEALAYNPDNGEILPFQITVQRKRKYDIVEMQKRFPLKLFVFDILYVDEWGDVTGQPYRARREIMDKVVKPGEVLELSPFKIVKTEKELAEIFDKAVRAGSEGIVVKRLDAGYRAGGRNFNWIKLKRSYEDKVSDTIDGVIVGYFFGKGQRASFGIGSLLLCVLDEKSGGFKTIAKAGSGLSEDDLSKLKRILDKCKTATKPKDVDSLIRPDVWVKPHYVTEVQADEITRSPIHTCGKTNKNMAGFALRFPRIVKLIRTEKSVRDATTVKEIIDIFKIQGRRK
ncbi:MAG: ATP-dependent DNA ligase [Candidatus Omnitrophica bacterium]|nr:ATP-dependent DNA ligase [Candidatus Omnitrophota bacterium]